MRDNHPGDLHGLVGRPRSRSRLKSRFPLRRLLAETRALARRTSKPKTFFVSRGTSLHPKGVGINLELLPDSRSQERFAELTSHVAARIFLFSKSHDCGQEVAHPSTHPPWAGPDSGREGRFSGRIRTSVVQGCFRFLQAQSLLGPIDHPPSAAATELLNNAIVGNGLANHAENQPLRTMPAGACS